MPSGERWHGTLGGYTNHACRCSDCRAAHAAYTRSYTESRKQPCVAGCGNKVGRGNTSGYCRACRLQDHGSGAWQRGCRCDVCRASETQHKRNWRARPENREHERAYDRERKRRQREAARA